MVSAMTTQDVTMGELLEQYPWARRALFSKFHIGGCASCGFADEESLSEVCGRNGGLSPDEVLEAVREAHAADEAMMQEPGDFGSAQLVDIRTSEEFEAVHIPGSLHFSQDLMNEIMNSWPRDKHIVIVDHTGNRSLDAAAYLA